MAVGKIGTATCPSNWVPECRCKYFKENNMSNGCYYHGNYRILMKCPYCYAYRGVLPCKVCGCDYGLSKSDRVFLRSLSSVEKKSWKDINIPYLIRKYRIVNRVTQQELVDEIEEISGIRLTRQAISLWENGDRYPHPILLPKLLRVIDSNSIGLLYWPSLIKRKKETVKCLNAGLEVPIRSVYIYATTRCNFKCIYCEKDFNFKKHKSISRKDIESILIKHGREVIYNIFGGEPLLIKWIKDFIDSHKEYIFYLHTNCYIEPPSNIKKLFVSLNTYKDGDFLYTTQTRGKKFQRIIHNIKYSSISTLTSIEYVITKLNYLEVGDFIEFCRKEFPYLYAIVFKLYSGDNNNLILTQNDLNIFLKIITPKANISKESLVLSDEILNKDRGKKINIDMPCYYSMSELCYSPYGKIVSRCYNLYQNGIAYNNIIKCSECLSLCNSAFSKFNLYVEKDFNNKTYSHLKNFNLIQYLEW